jgi:hypothetical protein
MSSRHPSVCSACRALVTWARFADNVVRPIESCADGEGTVALLPTLPGIGGRLEARQVVGVRTSFRLHLETCPKAYLYRNRWRTDLRCSVCAVPMVALENGRSLCATCQAVERARMVEVAGELVKLGREEAQEAIAAVLEPSTAKREVGDFGAVRVAGAKR